VTAVPRLGPMSGLIRRKPPSSAWKVVRKISLGEPLPQSLWPGKKVRPANSTYMRSASKKSFDILLLLDRCSTLRFKQ
jgi:hypothetical protein